jgi:predicted TIM-barrel fold metal-dependent hydrolase
MTPELAPDHRYTVISADAHAGADIADYRPYLSAQWHDEFDGWAASYVNPFADLLAPTAYRSWDSDRRLAENDADGITAEVIFPNTVPPFFEEGSLVALPPTEAEYDRRWAGIQAHNRWLADFCAKAPGRRAGVVQIFANHIEDALSEVRWAASTFSPFGGILLPSLPPGSGLPPLWDTVYEPLWGLCEELGIVVNVHGGGGLPDYGDAEVARAIMLVELPWFSHRSVWHLIFGGVLERHPGLKIVLTEQGMAWLPRGLETLDWFYGRMTLGDAAEANFFGAAAKGMSMTPTEYFERNFSVGASFLRASESALRHEVGVERIMWGADYPHSEGSYPFCREALRAAFGSCDPIETQQMVEMNVANLYGFDLEMLRGIGDVIGPTVAEVGTPLPVEEYPTNPTCNAFDRHQVLRSW